MTYEYIHKPVSVSIVTHKCLYELKRQMDVRYSKNHTFDDVINMLLEYYGSLL